MDSARDGPDLLGTLDGIFPWGLLLVAAEGSSDPIPEWIAGDQVTAGRTALVVKVQHEQEGSATVHVYTKAGDLTGEPAFTGAIASDSGAVIVSDALGERSIRVAAPIGAVNVSVFLEPPTNAVHVDVVID